MVNFFVGIFGWILFVVEALVDFAKVSVGDVSVNLSGADVFVAEQRLDGAEVGAGREKVGGEGVAERMRRNLFGDAG